MIVPPDIPGNEILNKGLRDLAAGEQTEEALLVLIGSPRLRTVFGEAIPEKMELSDSPEHLLFTLLESRLGRGAHSAYNALIRRLVSAENALKV